MGLLNSNRNQQKALSAVQREVFRIQVIEVLLTMSKKHHLELHKLIFSRRQSMLHKSNLNNIAPPKAWVQEDLNRKVDVWRGPN